MKKQILKSALMAMAGVGMLAGGAMALQLNFYDGTNTVTVLDNSSVDLNTSLDQVLYTGIVGKWSVYLASGISESSPPLLNLISFDANSGNTAVSTDYLEVSVYDTFSGGDFSGFITNINSSLNTFTGTDYEVTITDTNNATYTFNYLGIPNTGNPLGKYDITGFINTSMANFSGTWSINMTTTLHGIGKTSFDATTTPVPEPATMLLFGTGLAGLAAVARRRKTQA